MKFPDHAVLQLLIVLILNVQSVQIEKDHAESQEQIQEGIAFEDRRENEIKFRIVNLKAISKSYYPHDHDVLVNLQQYDELPFPIPFGPSVWFQLMLTLFISWYITEFLRYLIRRLRTVELYPTTQCFPKLYIHWLQQTKRECDLRREAKNTWAYTAKKLLMSPDDPLVNIEEACSTGWQDFHRHRDIWQVVKMVVVANSMLKHIQEQAKLTKSQKNPSDNSELRKPLKRINTRKDSETLRKDLDRAYQKQEGGKQK